ncbi:DUF3021 domain-containing protein [Candidatus Merdisoma sp. JLR.KK011]|uniref:DUF3021 domain-containing protein n=1 Tax=Candidatus Merdisoma sp. JLR.KK011 TaxID=3114299 RepID=UPI002FF1B845
MKKKILLRGALGFPLGITIGYIISIFVSLLWARGYYVPCEPELVTIMGNEIKAVIFQAVLCGILGAGFGGCSVIWEAEEWSLVKQTGIYFLLVSIIMMPAAYFNCWMEHSVGGFLSYFGIFVLIFVIVWVVQFLIGRQMVKKMNDCLYQVKDGMDG